MHFHYAQGRYAELSTVYLFRRYPKTVEICDETIGVNNILLFLLDILILLIEVIQLLGLDDVHIEVFRLLGG